jgi:hypothetical protein
MPSKRKKQKGARKPPNTSGLRPWKPGESGNPKGRPKGITLSEAYRAKLSDPFPGKDHTWAEEIAERMAKLALSRVSAATELADRTEGKAPQFMQLNSQLPPGPPPVFGVKFVSPRQDFQPKPSEPTAAEPLLLRGKDKEEDAEHVTH